MAQATVLIDTFNSANAAGTGIATYSRAAAAAAHTLGHRVALLTDRPIPVRERPFLGTPAVPRAIQIFDHPLAERHARSRQRNHPWWVSNRVYSLRRLVRHLALEKLGPVEHTDIAGLAAVETETLLARYGHFDEIVNVGGIFQHAAKRFAMRGLFARVSPPEPIEIAHMTWNLPISVAGARTIYTMHDLIPLRFPFTTVDDKQLYFDLVTACASAADVIATVSEHSRRDIIALLGVAEDKVVNTYLTHDIAAADLDNDPEATAAILRRAFGLRPRDYMLMVGVVEPRKNVARAIEARLAAHTRMPLVICGPRNVLSAGELKALMIKPPLPEGRIEAGEILLLDYVPRGILLELMRGARALLIPSLTEGFGLAAPEAMALGTPVIAARAGALPEVVGDAAVFVDPHSVQSIRSAIDDVSTWDADRIASAGRMGRARAAEFSADRFASRLAALYDRARA